MRIFLFKQKTRKLLWTWAKLYGKICIGRRELPKSRENYLKEKEGRKRICVTRTN